ncbi:hypothetical protein HBI56_094910 [Parastagonospora nodorum]|uniref:Uncharacterized protein n=1 Tax=Phaeosphaeria nodorum (strain SN15 / ATCC MYA-4574 / FGSC 10173) TaxID=321614 RepID=A0A7U2I3P2_PHANO|nr:hypothetical protein HBH56_090200 [Parastagonospora nodorum]QRC98202.1 hypothetical protein JI435_411690 [Parastagonospora nodorum SN15]KAH3936185.1 hypothetical protein HBH54_024840 [Parastagonospora nodorum]KAH3945676.1 hypothetical protein HBH53_141940 [Parastagonospora nodorum]KAH3989808.1 hypothetical protein HBH52_018430 [Parastagonospora nodorum]
MTYHVPVCSTYLKHGWLGHVWRAAERGGRQVVMAILMFMAGDRMREVETWWVSDALPARWKAGCVTLLGWRQIGAAGWV